jgi:exonuclease III
VGHGVAVLFDYRFTLMQSEIGVPGHLGRVLLQHQSGLRFIVVSVYQFSSSHVNSGSRVLLANKVLEWIMQPALASWDTSKLIVAGDLNSVVNCLLDRRSGKLHRHDVNGISALLSGVLTDSFRYCHPTNDVSPWTWKKIDLASRLDYLFVNCPAGDIASCSVLDGESNSLVAINSDHLPIVLELRAKSWFGRRLGPFPKCNRLREFIDYQALENVSMLSVFQKRVSSPENVSCWNSWLAVADLLEESSPLQERRTWADQCWKRVSTDILASMVDLRKTGCAKRVTKSCITTKVVLRNMLGHLRGINHKLRLGGSDSFRLASLWPRRFNSQVRLLRHSYGIGFLPNEWIIWERCLCDGLVSMQLYHVFVSGFFLLVTRFNIAILNWIQADVKHEIRQRLVKRDLKLDSILRSKKGGGVIRKLTGKRGLQIAIESAVVQGPDGSSAVVTDEV